MDTRTQFKQIELHINIRKNWERVSVFLCCMLLLVSVLTSLVGCDKTDNEAYNNSDEIPVFKLGIADDGSIIDISIINNGTWPRGVYSDPFWQPEDGILYMDQDGNIPDTVMLYQDCGCVAIYLDPSDLTNELYSSYTKGGGSLSFNDWLDTHKEDNKKDPIDNNTEIWPVIGAAMEPAICHNDNVVVLRTQIIDYNDIIIFLNTNTEFPSHYMIKRVIGKPGDLMETRYSQVENAWHVYRNGEIVDESYIKEPIHSDAYNAFSEIVPAGQYFVLGDNRNNSFDSHVPGFYAHINSIVGKVILVQ